MESKLDNEVGKNLNKESCTIIPIDDYLKNFYYHLSYNDRTIFSAKFGDGKTYFLGKFFIKYSSEFEVIKLFPVNYQVEDNKDIFELIKRDILFHLLANDHIENNNIIDDLIIAQYYLFNHGADILLDLLSDIPKIKIPVPIIQKFLKHFKNYKEFSEKTSMQNADIAKKYISRFESVSGAYEYDTISSLITKCIQEIKKKGKKVVLLVEDLDRIDPAHLFRILNILTAHIDRNHILVHDTDIENINNKFDFSNIIIVFDYANTKNIYQHFYGSDTSFEGYINKFATQRPFNYSLKEVAINHGITSLSRILEISPQFFSDNSIIKEKLEKLSIRDLMAILRDTECEIIQDMLTTADEYKISTVNKLTKFLVFLKRLCIYPDTIISDIYKQDKVLFMNIIGVGWFYAGAKIGNSALIIPARDYSSMSYNLSFDLTETDQVINCISFNGRNNSCSFDSIRPYAINSIDYFTKYIKH